MSEAYRGETLRLTDQRLMPLERWALRDEHFIDCTILGPAVVHPGEGTTRKGGRWEGPSDDVKEGWEWEMPPAEIHRFGVVELEQCSFVDCVFRGIGFVGTDDERMRWVRRGE